MGVDLTLIPERYPAMEGKPLAYSRIAVNCRNYDLWESLTSVSTELPSGILWYDDEGLQDRIANPYGEPISFVTAGKFVELWDRHCFDVGEWDMAVIAFVRALPVARRLFLWFH